jgi:hypothetical protein
MEEELSVSVTADSIVKVFAEDPTASPKKRSLDDDNESDSEGDTHPTRFKRQNTGSAKSDITAHSPSMLQLRHSSNMDDVVMTGHNQGSLSPNGHQTSQNGQGIGPKGASSGATSGQQLSLRSLVSTKDAGVIIGKGGTSVAEIRAKSGARITVSEMLSGATERVLTCMGTPDTVSKVQDVPSFCIALDLLTLFFRLMG